MTDRGMTLAFDLAALRRLADPASAVAEAERWSSHVGVVADDPERVWEVLDRTGVDFVTDRDDETGGLAVAGRQFPAPRHVFVGTTDADARYASSAGWEYVDVADAAEASGWTLAAAEGRWRSADEGT